MKAIARDILLASFITAFAIFGAVSPRHPKEKMTPAQAAEVRKETLTCLSVAFLACSLCAWRCFIIKQKLNKEQEYQRRFNEYMRSSAFNRHYNA